MNTNIFELLEGFIKVTTLLLVLIGIIIYIFIKKGGQQYISEWTRHRDNPQMIPVAGVFGKNPQQNFQGVMYTKFKTNFAFLIKPVQYIIKLISDILGKLLNSMNIFRTILKPIRNFFTQAATSFYDKLNSFSIMIVYFFSKMRNLLRRLASSFRLVLYTLQAVQLTMKSVWNGPIGNVSRNWAYANDTLHNYFCFHRDTLIKLHNKNYIPISDLKIGMRLHDIPNNIEPIIITGVVTSLTNKTEMYKVANIIMTKSHLVNQNGVWIRASEVGTYIGTSTNELVYCPMTSNRELIFNQLITKDFTEINNDILSSYIINYSLSNLNGIYNKFVFSKIQLDSESGVSGDSEINKEDGTIVKAKDIKIGCLLDTGRVTAISVFQVYNTETYRITPTLQITPRQIIYYNNTWNMYYNKCKTNILKNKTKTLYYSFHTASGKYKSGNIIMTDMFDGLSADSQNVIDRLTTTFLNT